MEIIKEPWLFGRCSPDPPSDDYYACLATPDPRSPPDSPLYHAYAHVGAMSTALYDGAPDHQPAHIPTDTGGDDTITPADGEADDRTWAHAPEAGDESSEETAEASVESLPDQGDASCANPLFVNPRARKRGRWADHWQKHAFEAERLTLAAAVPLRLYVRGPSAQAVAAAAAAFGPVPWMVDPGLQTRRATAPGMDPHLMHAPSSMVDNAAYIAGRSAYIAVQHEALQTHRDRGMALLSDAVASPGRPMDLRSVLDLYTRRLAIAHVQSLRRRVIALSALYDHATRGTRTLPEAVRVAASTASGVEMAAAWYARWAATAAPLQTADQPCEVVDGEDRPDARPLQWVPVGGNTGVPLAAGVPVFYAGRVTDPLVCPVHRDVENRPTCPPGACVHRTLLESVSACLCDPWAVESRLVELVAADADTVEFAMRVRAIVNDTLDRARRRWGRCDPVALREPVDLFSECPVDAFVLVRTAADGALLPHAIGVVPRFDIELCM